MNHNEAFTGKISALRNLLAEKELDALILRRNPNLAWTISGRAHVPTTIDTACFDLVITEGSIYAVTNAIEAPRLAGEEFPDGLKIKVVQWWEGRDNGLSSDLNIGSDQPGPGLVDLSLEIEMLRASLDLYDQGRIASISERAAKALGDALKDVTSSDREIDVAARITAALWRNNLEISFLGVAGESRVKKFRHPLPTDELIGNRASASICAKEKGLIASVTRIVTFTQLSQSEESEYVSLLEVEADLLDATIIGNSFSSVIDIATRSYGLHGFDSDEWHHHHQGGPSGFLPRDWPATQSSARLIQENQVIAWNPTGKGWKCEDTIITNDSGVILLSNDPTWPTRDVRGRIRPDLLRR
jgi:antitoxin VapB